MTDAGCGKGNGKSLRLESLEGLEGLEGQGVEGQSRGNEPQVRGCLATQHRVTADLEVRTWSSLGAVTAEFAVALPAVLFLLAMLLAGAAAGVTQLRLEGAARAGARELARGGDSAAVAETVHLVAGGSAVAAVSAEGGWSTVTVSDRAGGPLGVMVPWTLTATATARTEALAWLEGLGGGRVA